MANCCCDLQPIHGKVCDSVMARECWRRREEAELESTTLRFLHLVCAAGEAGC